ncbi:hypothetical protein N0P70_005503 [Klebsiella michiganensis]|nr:hypothetical protein [Klebsiella michiganensis]
MTVIYLKTKIKNTTGGHYEWRVKLGNEEFCGSLEDVKHKVLVYASRLR